MNLNSLSPEVSLNKEDISISVHRQVSIDGDNEDEKQVGRECFMPKILLLYLLVTVSLGNIAR